MILNVPYEEFPAAAKRIGAKDAFVSERPGGSVITAADPHKNVIVVCTCECSFEDVQRDLTKEEIKAAKGRWADASPILDGGVDGQGAYVAAVSYQSASHMPGLWMDAYPTAPTPQIVLRGMYDEFRENHEIGNVTYEEFLRWAHPNVVILSPSEIATYLSQKEEC